MYKTFLCAIYFETDLLFVAYVFGMSLVEGVNSNLFIVVASSNQPQLSS